MTEPISAYPLCWPPAFPRTARRDDGQFKTSLSAALSNVQDSLRRFAADTGKKIEGLVISSNVTLGQQRPADPGVAVWFTWDGLQVCIPVDRYAKVEANLQAIHHVLEARRTELRHGGIAIVRATFTGFKALPPPPGSDWRTVLLLANDERNMQTVEQAYQRERSKAHPDKGGSAERFDAVQRAYERARQELGAN